MRKRFFLLLFIILVLVSLNSLFKKTPVTKCVQIYYDHAPTTSDPAYYQGRLYAIGLQNLLAHFPTIQQYIIPIELYQKGQLERCEASFYLGTYYNNTLPQDFLNDFANTRKTVVWIGYNLWQLTQKNLETIWSAAFIDLFSPDWKKTDRQGRPGIYNYFTYKGEVFERCKYDKSPADAAGFKEHYSVDYDIALLKLLNKAAEKQVIAWAYFTMSKARTPYIIKNFNHWYIADNPFAFICEGDRYFIFTDILFDILHEKPQDNGKRYALVRYEDVSPKQSLVKMTVLANMFAKLNVHFAISLIPIYVDPFKISNAPYSISMENAPLFINALKYEKKQGASFILHSVTHQYNQKKNPFSGITGDDFEFWDKSTAGPIAEDSVPYVLQRLTKGVQLVQEAGFKIAAWMPAHYRASALDNTIFGQVFAWNIIRGNYKVSKICHLASLPINLTYDQGIVNDKTNQERLAALANLQVMTFGNAKLHQLFPYPIYGDYYGQRIIPEDLGNIQTVLSDQVVTKRTVDDIIKDAKRYTVLRDVWASFFIHDLLLDISVSNRTGKYQYNTRELERLIKAIKSDGYEFVNLEQWTAAHSAIKRPEPIEVGAIGSC